MHTKQGTRGLQLGLKGLIAGMADMTEINRILPRLIFAFLLLAAPISSVHPPEKPQGWDTWEFNQKIVWRGLNLDPRIPYGLLVDKLRVKKIVQDEIATAKVFFATNNPAEIILGNLPKSFIMKANNASGRGILVKDGVVIASKKRDTNFLKKECSDEFLRSSAEKWLANLYAAAKEKQYALVEPMIIFEEFLENIKLEIELYLFNGKVRVIGVFFVEGYEKNPVVSYYDENWNLFHINHPKFLVKNEPIEKPAYIDKLIAFGERFGEKIDHVRVDFFITADEIYFGEFTFTTGGGKNLPHLNWMIGDYWDLPDPNDPLINSYLNHLINAL